MLCVEELWGWSFFLSFFCECLLRIKVLYELYNTFQSGVLFSKSLGYKKIPPPWITSAIHFTQAQRNTSNIM